VEWTVGLSFVGIRPNREPPFLGNPGSFVNDVLGLILLTVKKRHDIDMGSSEVDPILKSPNQYLA
jgi:hypothetical protein